MKWLSHRSNDIKKKITCHRYADAQLKMYYKGPWFSISKRVLTHSRVFQTWHPKMEVPHAFEIQNFSISLFLGFYSNLPDLSKEIGYNGEI